MSRVVAAPVPTAVELAKPADAFAPSAVALAPLADEPLPTAMLLAPPDRNNSLGEAAARLPLASVVTALMAPLATVPDWADLLAADPTPEKR